MQQWVALAVSQEVGGSLPNFHKLEKFITTVITAREAWPADYRS